MEKIMLVIAGSSPALQATQFATYLAGMTHSKLIGYFFEYELYADKPEIKTILGFPFVESIVAEDLPELAEKKKTINDHRRKFENTCSEKGIFSSSSYLEWPVLPTLITDSRFADVIIVDATFCHLSDKQDELSSFLQHLLANAQCPVIITPTGFSSMEEVIFLYDSSPSAVFAIKQFCYLFPELDEARATVVNTNKKTISSEEKKQINNWLCRHFGYTDFLDINDENEPVLLDYLLKKQNPIIIMGADKRSFISRLFRHSYTELMLKTLAYPVFITHH
ncbi:MAG: hypothetical protein JO154_23495 [Chitinophaga sp.]|uniref:hypothetical protein n=1 Tax=Chitinophaga sp. TaxID=1869181 RepID=UPI0025C20159|nr:hypothetical protein [Chitinophaga sp.]MBV8255579.1 hypothetical protein [Chitinophaga sp.]